MSYHTHICSFSIMPLESITSSLPFFFFFLSRLHTTVVVGAWVHHPKTKSYKLFQISCRCPRNLPSSNNTIKGYLNMIPQPDYKNRFITVPRVRWPEGETSKMKLFQYLQPFQFSIASIIKMLLPKMQLTIYHRMIVSVAIYIF